MRNLDRFPMPLLYLGDSILASILFGIVLGAILYIPLKIIAELVRASARRSAPEVNFERSEIRCGRKALPFADLDRAFLDLEPGLKTWTALELRLRATNSFDFIVPLRVGEDLVLAPETKALLLRFLPETLIEMPVDRYDPKGKFSKYNFPGNLTKDDVIALVTNPPKPGDPLPIPG